MRKSEKPATHGAADLQAQLSEAWSRQFSQPGDTYGRLMAAIRDEFTGFVQRRVEANLSTMREWSECRSFNDAVALQQRWVQCAVEQYVEEGNRMLETCREAGADVPESTAQQATAPFKSAERKSAAHRSESHFKQVA